MRRLPSIAAFVAAAVCGSVLAKLPALSDDAKAKAAEAAAKSAWTEKVGLYKLCLSMDRVADGYRKTVKAAGKDAPSPAASPACADPGAYVSSVTPTASKPLEASEAHSPAGMAVSPPSSKATSAELTGGPKK
jgi:hypothetical protein